MTEILSEKILPVTRLSEDVLGEIFTYLALGEIFFSFYRINQFYKDFIDRRFSSLNFIGTSYRYLIFYYNHVVNNNSEHCSRVKRLILSNEKPFDHFARFFPLIHLYTNLQRLHLKFANLERLELLPALIPNLSELYVIVDNGKHVHVNWLSSLKQLKICSIEATKYGIEIHPSMRFLSSPISSLFITLSSTYDFHALLRLLAADSLCELNVHLCDDRYEYLKTSHGWIRSAKHLTKFTFDMTHQPIKSAISLYGIIQFVSDAFRHVQTLTILCRFADGIIVDEDKLRYYLSFIYSVNEFRLFIEMNDLSQILFDESVYTHSFWTKKNLHVNIYQNNDQVTQHVRIYTSPFFSKKSCCLIDDCYHQIQSSDSSNIHRFLPKNLSDENDQLNVVLFPSLTRVSSITINNENIISFANLLRRQQIYPKLRKLYYSYSIDFFIKHIRTIYQRFPCLQSLSISNVSQFDSIQDILRSIRLLLNRSAFIHLCISGLYFDEIYFGNPNEEQLKISLNEILIQPFLHDRPYSLTFTPSSQSIDFWF